MAEGGGGGGGGALPHVALHIAESALEAGALRLLEALRPAWQPRRVTFRLFTDGITNKLIGCFYKDEDGTEGSVLIRVYGNKTDLLIDRKAELRNMKLLQHYNLAPKVYGVFENGLAYEFLPGVTLTPDSVIDPKIWKHITRVMATMHKIDLGAKVPKQPALWEKCEQFLSLLPEPFSDPNKQERFANQLGSVSKIRLEYERLKAHLMAADSPIVFAHNDLLLGNVIYNEAENKVTFIDYEYAAYNYQAFDIANHFAEFVGISEIDYKMYPSKEFQLVWLRDYLKHYLDVEPSEQQVETLYTEVNQFVLAAHFLWAVWALVQYQLSHIEFDFLEFAVTRLGEYNRLKDNVYRQRS